MRRRYAKDVLQGEKGSRAWALAAAGHGVEGNGGDATDRASKLLNEPIVHTRLVKAVHAGEEANVLARMVLAETDDALGRFKACALFKHNTRQALQERRSLHRPHLRLQVCNQLWCTEDWLGLGSLGMLVLLQ